MGLFFLCGLVMTHAGSCQILRSTSVEVKTTGKLTPR